MEDQNYDLLFEQLATTLKQGGFAWLVRQVSERILVGKISIAPSTTGKKRSSKKRDASSGTFSTAYTPKERVELLIETFRHVINTNEMERKMFSFFERTSHNNIEAIEFHSELEEDMPLVLTHEHIDERHIQAHKITEVLDTLLEATNHVH
ncbi:MAG TPA: hypothetical protein VFV38_02080 [Ktedonobacteraceae bacterium]|nr:hypothetical protein [Ktedonobacteraceae bacterium]